MSEEQKRLGAFPFVIGGLSFIPAFGVFFGIVSIIWGLATKKVGGKKLAIVGISGIGFTFILYGSLFYFGFVQRGGVYDDLRTQLGETTLTSLAQSIEFYKMQTGHYPESLKTLKESLPENALVFVYDSTTTQLDGEPNYYHYKILNESSYYLLGVGPDGRPAVYKR